jgi:N-glycosylase/DNA lyase
MEKRDWVYNNINGFGLKASSHFLRNIGCKELPIIDTHIVRFLLGKKPSNEKQYKALENEFINICKNKNIVPAALDAYIWAVFSNTDYSSFDY